MPVLPGLRGEQRDEELQAHPGLLPQILQGHPQLQETSRDGSQVRYFSRDLVTIRPEFVYRKHLKIPIVLGVVQSTYVYVDSV